MGDAFFEPDGHGTYRATAWTRGPWSAVHQHAGPPSALVGRALEACAPDGGRLARFTVEILRPVPIVPVTVSARVVRPGRQVSLLTGELLAGDEPILRATGWWLRTEDAALPDLPPVSAPALGPEAARIEGGFEGFGEVSYFTAMEWRFASGAFWRTGPAAAWLRMRIPLVPDEEPSPLVRVLVAADSSNGISGVLPLDRYLFVNTDLSVHLTRHPVGQWVHLDAETSLDGAGIGLATAVLSDQQGPFGRGLQTLFVAPR